MNDRDELLCECGRRHPITDDLYAFGCECGRTYVRRDPPRQEWMRRAEVAIEAESQAAHEKHMKALRENRRRMRAAS